jgi:hypothetical protein
VADVANPDPPVVSPGDEGRHAPGAEELWNESWYFDVADPAAEVGAYLRFGLYPNRSQTWFQIVVAGRDRPLTMLVDESAPLAVGDGLELDAGRWSAHLEAVTPLEIWRVTARAQAQQFSDPTAVVRQEQGSPVEVEVDLTWTTVGPPYHYGRGSRYEVSSRVVGTVRVGDETIELDAPGQRDHSWGVRDWWAFGWCWSAGALGDGTAFHAADIRFGGSSVGFGYVVDAHGRSTPATRICVTEELDRDLVPTDARIAIEPGALEVSMVPIAVSPIVFVSDDGRVSRMTRVLCRYSTPDGRTGSGWTEWNLLQEQPS